MPRSDALKGVTSPPLEADVADETAQETPGRFYRVPFSTAEVEATLATLFAVADLLDSWGEEDSPLAPQVHALRVSADLLRSAADRIELELPDFVAFRAEKETRALAALFQSVNLNAPERSKRQLLEAARDAQTSVEIEYYVPSRDEVTRRTVDVRGVFDEPGGAYLSGYCHLRRDQRMFKLENIRAVRSIESSDEEIADPFASP